MATNMHTQALKSMRRANKGAYVQAQYIGVAFVNSQHEAGDQALTDDAVFLKHNIT